MIMLFTFLLAAAAGETILRIFYSTPPALYKCRDKYAHHKMIPNTSGRAVTREYNVVYTSGSDGFRSPEFTEKKPPGTFRVVVLGDSFTMGYGVSESAMFTSVLEDMLDQEYKDSGLTFQIINRGMASYSPVVEYVVLRKYGIKYSPDLVILCLDWSDLMNDFWYENQAVFDDRGRPLYFKNGPEKKAENQNHVTLEFWKMSYLYDLWHYRFSNKPEELNPDPGNPFKDAFFFMRSIPQENFARLYLRTAGYIEMIAQLCKQKSIEFVVVMYPNGAQVSGREWAVGRQMYLIERGKIYSDQPFRIMGGLLESRGINTVSLLEAFRESNEFPLYFPEDGHLTPAGHHLFAKELATIVDNYIDPR